MGQLRAIQIFVVGRTRRPGSYTVSSLSSLVDALFVSGGPASTGSMRRIEVKRGSSIVTELDLYSFLLNGDKSKDIPLLPGDIIYVRPAGPRVALTGSVSQPAIFEIRSGETVGDVLAMAGGLTSLATMESGELERIDTSGQRHVIEIHFDAAGLKVPLADGDILRVLSIVPRFDNAVTLRGNVANPGRYPWHAGMRITDLIPNKDALLTRNYWKRKNSLVFTNLDEQTQTPDEDNGAVSPPDKAHAADSSRGSPQEEDSGNSGTAAPAPKPEDKNQTPPADSTAGGGESNGLTGNGGSIASQTGAPSERFPVSNRVDKRVPEIDWDYAVIERLNTDDLATSLKPFNLGRALLEKDEKDNLELQPGDIVTIFSQADIHVPQTRQTTFVRLEGEFQAAGVYSVQPGETLRELVERAGGLTKGAYLFGSSFTRESTRRQQQAQLDEYSADLEQRHRTSRGNTIQLRRQCSRGRDRIGEPRKPAGPGSEASLDAGHGKNRARHCTGKYGRGQHPRPSARRRRQLRCASQTLERQGCGRSLRPERLYLRKLAQSRGLPATGWWHCEERR